MDNDILTQQLSRLLIQNKKKMINERDIINLCSNEEEYNEVIPILVKNFKLIGFSLIRTTYQGNRYLVLTSAGKDDKISPSMYGVLGLIIALYNEIGHDIEITKIKNIFSDLWDDIEELMSQNYLEIINNRGMDILAITPIGKAAFKNILKDLNLPTLLSIANFEEKPELIDKNIEKITPIKKEIKTEKKTLRTKRQ